MGAHPDTSSSTDTCSSSSDSSTTHTTCEVLPEDIHRVLLEAYSIVTNCHRDFECRKKDLYCLHKRYRCLFNPFFPHFFKFVRDCYGFEYLFFIATVGNLAIDFIAYFDLFDWVVLTDGACYRRYRFGGCSKLQFTVTKRQCNLTAEEKCRFEAKKREIEALKVNGNYCYGKDVVTDFRCRPTCKIEEPCNRSKIKDCKLKLKVHFKNWPLSGCKKFKVYVDNKCQGIYDHHEVCLHLDKVCKGWHKLVVVLWDEKTHCPRGSCCIKIYICKDCKCCSSSSSSCSSSTKCCSSSSSSDCCSSSSSTKCCKKDKCCSSSSSSDCCDSSSSSDCSSSSSSWDCCSSSSSSCSSSTKCCKKDKCCSSSSSSCSSSSSDDCCSSSSDCSSSCSKEKKFKCSSSEDDCWFKNVDKDKYKCKKVPRVLPCPKGVQCAPCTDGAYAYKQPCFVKKGCYECPLTWSRECCEKKCESSSSSCSSSSSSECCDSSSSSDCSSSTKCWKEKKCYTKKEKKC